MSKAKKTTKYVVVQNINISQHCVQCSDLMGEGYVPLGGPSVVESTKNSNALVITQAFIKEFKE